MSADRPSWDPRPANGSSNNECENCGAHVHPSQIRIYGTNDGHLFACLSCMSSRDLRQGAGKDPDYDPATHRGQNTASGWNPIFLGDGE